MGQTQALRINSQLFRLCALLLLLVVPFLVLLDAAHQLAKTTLDACRKNLANFKVPRHVEIVGELPLNATGKVVLEG